MFVTTLLHKTQLNLINFTIKQLSLKFVYSVLLAEQLQLHKNEILIKIVHNALETMF
jgi:hypothetical protein